MSGKETKRVVDEFWKAFESSQTTLTDTFIEASILLSAIGSDEVYAQYDEVHDRFVEMMDLIDHSADILNTTTMRLLAVNDGLWDASDDDPIAHQDPT